MSQTVFSGVDSHKKITDILHELGPKSFACLCSSFKYLGLKDFIESRMRKLLGLAVSHLIRITMMFVKEFPCSIAKIVM